MSDTTHEIVINIHYGGYRLNGKVVKRLAELGCKEARDFIEKCDRTHAKRTPEEIEWDKEFPDPDPYRSYILNEDRMNPFLIKVVKELQEEAGSLQVVTFKGNLYRIIKRDGAETIETPDSIKWKYVH